MNQLQQELLEQQKNTWNKYSAGWRVWDEVLMTSMRPVAESLINVLKITGNEHVLDVASGTGGPGLTNQLLTNTGLSEVMEYRVNGEATFASPKIYWNIFSDVAGPIMAALNNQLQEVIDEVKQVVLTKAGNMLRDGLLYTDWEANIASGIKK